MGLFSKLFKSSPVDDCVRFLNEADTVYTRAFQVKNAAGLEKYFTRPCLSKMVERIRLSEKAYSGLERYRHTNWRQVEPLKYIKEVRYDDVVISKGVRAPVGDSFDEEWILIQADDKYLVNSLRRLA